MKHIAVNIPSNSKRNSAIVWLYLLIAVLVLSLSASHSASRRSGRRVEAIIRTDDRLSKLPQTILWAWERPEKLDFINTETTGVAFLAKTLYLRGNRVIARPRLQPLVLRPGVPVIAVVRIESNAASLSHDQMESSAGEIGELAQLSNVVAVQIDFDAKKSERAFYSELLAQVRKALPPATALSMTALASWCQGDDWLDKLPVDEAVPMLFRMGVDRSQIVSCLASGEQFRSPLCRQSTGVATDELLAHVPASKRVYVFNPISWSPSSVKKILEREQR